MENEDENEEKDETGILVCASTGEQITWDELCQQVKDNPVCSKSCIDDPIAYDSYGIGWTAQDVAFWIGVKIEVI